MVADGAGPPDPEHLLAESAASLGARLAEVVPAWVAREVARIIDAWDATGPAPGVDHAAVRTEALEAGRRAQEEVAGRLYALLSSDLAAQSSTPLEIVRAAVTYPTAVLRHARVPAVVRDAFDESRFPDDIYGLTPASLGAVDESLVDPARAWGAAKAMAHKARHRTGQV